MRRIAATLALCLAAGAATAQSEGLAPGASIAFFGITFIDTSTEGALNGVREDETARLDLVTDYVRDAFEERGFELLDLAPVQERLDRTVNPAKCNNCEVRMAAELGADYSLTGEVQKVSNLILSMNLVVRDAETGAKVRGRSVDIRANTDESWVRGFSYLLRNTIFRE